MTAQTHLRGVILDMDGTLIDSNDAHARAYQRAMAENGFDVAYEDIRKRIGMGGDNLVPETIGISEESPDGEKIATRKSEIFQTEYLPQLQAFPKVRELVQRLRADGFTITVASSAEADDLEPMLEIANIADLIVESTSSGDAENSKPDPDIIHAALNKLGMSAGEVIMLGDTPYDVQAAGKAGVAVIGLRCGGFPDEALEGSVALYDDPASLLVYYDESPLGARERGSSPRAG